MDQEFVPDDVATLDLTGKKRERPRNDMTYDSYTVYLSFIGGEGSEAVSAAAAAEIIVNAPPDLEESIMAVAAGSKDGAATAAAAAGNPILMLDQDQISQLESVLSSDEAKSMLGVEALMVGDDGDIVLGEAPGPGVKDDLEEDVGGQIMMQLEQPEAQNQQQQPQSPKKSKTAPPKRRSQRQMDKEMKEEAERIRLENQALMKKEREEQEQQQHSKLQKQELVGDSSSSSSSEAPPVSEAVKTTPAGRPRRERKIPAHLKGDFETPLVVEPKEPPKEAEEKMEVDEADFEAPTVAISQPTDVVKPPAGDGDDDDDSDSGDSDFNSEDDPERLWCVCKQPHNNRFMICCDNCLDWYHGKCVGITKRMGKEMEEVGNEWRCPKCVEVTKQAKEDAQKAELAKKLKEREEVKKKEIIAKGKLKRSDSGSKQEVGGKQEVRTIVMSVDNLT